VEAPYIQDLSHQAGSGGGGAGGAPSPGDGIDATVNTGSGGGSSSFPGNVPGGDGGSGVVIVKEPLSASSVWDLRRVFIQVKANEWTN